MGEFKSWLSGDSGRSLYDRMTTAYQESHYADHFNAVEEATRQDVVSLIRMVNMGGGGFDKRAEGMLERTERRIYVQKRSFGGL